MLLRSEFKRGTTYLNGIEFSVRDFRLEVPAELAIDLVLRGHYMPFARYRKLTSRCKKILIIRGSGLGDVIMCHPIRKYIKQKYPDIELHFATDSKYSCVVDGDPTADKVYDQARAIAFTRKEKYDFAANLNNMEFTHFQLIGQKHKIDLMAGGVGIIHPIEDKNLFYKITDQEIKWAKERTITKKKKLAFVLQSTCGTKHMKPALVIKILQHLVEHEIVVYIFDASKKFGKVVSQGVNSTNIVNCCGKFNVRQCAAIMNECDLVFTPDTGFMHLSIAMGKKVLAYFGSMGSDVVLTPGNVTTICKEELDCQPCGRFDCPRKTEECLKFDPKWMTEQIVKKLGE